MPTRFPTVAALCAEAGIDPATQPIPVRPAAHYHMGGVMVDGHGASSVAGLFACGEVSSPACTAQTGSPATRCWKGSPCRLHRRRLDVPPPGRIVPDTAAPRTGADLSAIRAIMETRVGVVREADGLASAVAELKPSPRTATPPWWPR